MDSKFDLRTKTYILFLIFFIFNLKGFFQDLLHSNQIQSSSIIFSIASIIILTFPLVLLIINTEKSKMYGWGVSLIIFLIVFFFGIYLKVIDYQTNQFTNNYFSIMIIVLVSFVLVLYSMSKLKKFENKSFDKWISYAFIFVGIVLPSSIGIFHTISKIYFQYWMLYIIYYLSTPIVYLILLGVWIKAEKNKDLKEFDLRTKIFILILLSSVSSIPGAITSLWRLYPHLIISKIFFLSSLIIIFCYGKEKRKIAWVIGIIPYLITLFNPLKSPLNKGVYQGRILYLIQSISFKDPVTALLILTGSVIPILIIVFAVSKIIDYKKNNFDRKIVTFFIVFYFIRPAIERIIKGVMSTDFSLGTEFIISVLLSLITNISTILFIVALLVWIYLEKKSKTKEK